MPKENSLTNTCAEPDQLNSLAFDCDDCLIYGIGNVGREDDGLGWAFVDWVESSGLCPRADLIRHYQLMPEDADLISRKNRVLFVDATKSLEVNSVRFEAVAGQFDLSFTSHALSIPTVIALCRICFDRTPQVHLLTIRGYEWGLKVGLTDAAACNLENAKRLFASKGIGHD